MALIDFALQYAARGWSVFPLRPRSKLPLISAKAGGRGFHDATTDPAQIEAWWKACPEANIGIATGASGLVVLDADGPKGLRQFQALNLPRTRVQRTGRESGFHFVYRGSAPSWQDNRKGEAKQWFLDVRGSTGYIIVSPSVHPSGTVYQWIDPTAPVVDLPPAAAAWIAARKGSGPLLNPALTPGSAPARFVEAPESPADQGQTKSKRGLAARSVANLTQNTPPFSESEADRLFSALSMIDAATDGATWFSIGAALHDLKWSVNGTDEGFEIWDEWSSTSKGEGAGNGEYRGRADLEKRWAGFDREYNGIRTTVASIYKRAFELGWQYDPGQASDNSDSHSEGLNGFAHNFSNQSGFTPPIIWPDKDQWGRPKPTCRNARAAIRHMGLTCEHDTFHDKLIVGGQAIDQWAGEVTDNTVHMLRVTIERTYKVDPGTTSTFDAAVQECLQGGYDPVADYLDGLQWDGVPRLRSWLATYMGAADTPLNAALGGLTLVAAVRRVRVPGCKYDQILVLEGPEGRGKSSAIEILAGKDNFSDQTILTLDDKGQQEAISGVWLYEIADLAGMSKADTEKVKAFCSRTVDRARPAYGRTRQDRPRRCVFIATTNHDTYLKSQTGNRRFGSVRTGHVNLEALRRDRDQLWAEASVVERRGVPLFLPEALWGDAAAIQDSRREADPWDDVLSYLVDGAKTHNAVKLKQSPDGRGMEYRITTRDVLENVLRLPLEKMTDVTAKRAAIVMRRLGWEGPRVIRDGEETFKGYRRKAVTG